MKETTSRVDIRRVTKENGFLLVQHFLSSFLTTKKKERKRKMLGIKCLADIFPGVLSKGSK